MYMTEQGEDEEYWQNELRALGIDPKRKNELNDREELESLAESVKRMYYQDYKTAYETAEESQFDYII
jgi:hypothetical protein